MTYEVGVLILRLVVGGVMFGHGAQKLFGWFGGYGLAGTSGYFEGQLRLRPATLWTLLAGLSEAGGGLLLALGLLNPLGSLGIIAAMLMAIVLVHWPRFWERSSPRPRTECRAAAACATRANATAHGWRERRSSPAPTGIQWQRYDAPESPR